MRLTSKTHNFSRWQICRCVWQPRAPGSASAPLPQNAENYTFFPTACWQTHAEAYLAVADSGVEAAVRPQYIPQGRQVGGCLSTAVEGVLPAQYKCGTDSTNAAVRQQQQWCPCLGHHSSTNNTTKSSSNSIYATSALQHATAHCRSVHQSTEQVLRCSPFCSAAQYRGAHGMELLSAMRIAHVNL